MTAQVVIDGLWGRVVDDLTALSLHLADRHADDAHKATRRLVEATEGHKFEPISLIFGVRWSLAGRLDADPGDLVSLAAMGLTTLATMDLPPPPRREQARRGEPPR